MSVFFSSRKTVLKNWLDTSSIASYLSSFLSLFLIATPTAPRYLVDQLRMLLPPRQLLDTWWIDREFSYLLNSFSTPGGSIELLVLDLIPYCSIHQLSTSFFSTPTWTTSPTPLDTSSVEHYLRFYLNLLVRSGSHFTRSLSRLLPIFSPKLSHLTPISFLKGFFKIFQVFPLLVSF